VVRINNQPLLEVIDMSVSFKMYEKGLKQCNQLAISNLSISVNRGEILAIVGSSGSGKSLLAHGILGLLPRNAIMTGSLKYNGEDLNKKRIEKLRGNKIALIPQSISYLDPLIKIGKQVQGANRSNESKKCQRKSFERYDLCEKSEKLYPFQLSGGMARRVLVSTADQNDVDLIIADEPTPGLDLQIAMKTLKYFRDFADQEKGVLMITHDIDLALNVADKIAVFYAGTILEIASVADFNAGIEHLRHPYTKALFEALPQNGFKPIKGIQPSGREMSNECIFSHSCESKNEKCRTKIPMRELRGGMVRCNHAT
jgi:peptide/nickel transport system ATP-binding protein